MFSLTSGPAHSKRKRIFASAYSKTSVSQDRVQNIIKTRVSKLLNFIDHHASGAKQSRGEGGPLVVRRIFRALQADIFTAFAFSNETGSTYLDRLTGGTYAMDDLCTSDMDLFHDDKREEYFFWESEKPFKYFAHLVFRNISRQHLKAQRWISDFVANFEAGLSAKSASLSDKSIKRGDSGVYQKLLCYKDLKTGSPMTSAEKASEVMDHAGQCC